MRRVSCLIRSNPHYRRDAFFEGFKRLGFTINDIPGRDGRIRPTDILVVWNRYGAFDAQAKLFARAGATVIVAENGYLPMKGTKKAFALSLDQHNGAGTWPEMESRAERLDVTLKPWRNAGDEILILPQRGIGPAGVAMPKGWQADIEHRLRGAKFRTRQHPGINDVKPVERDLDGVKCAVTWGSGAALKALCEGVPVFHDFPKWIGRFGARHGLAHIDEHAAARGDRQLMLENVSRAQWSVEEVETGEPFARLLEMGRALEQCA